MRFLLGVFAPALLMCAAVNFAITGRWFWVGFFSVIIFALVDIARSCE